ncbi:hypothetical protein B0H11DRAFT_1725397 [Mycena galericulata]|nr:hypothetical protein B0H11DRAFT_1725397 [Mycena galericulata]
MNDFFSVVGSGMLESHHQTDDIKSFAEAISQRFGQGTDQQQQTARVLIPPLALRMSDTPPPLATLPPDPSSTAVHPDSLSLWLDDPHTLVVDIRPHAAYSSARISRAVSLSVPSTLLKRPLFSLQRLSAMLPSHSARTRFSAWRSASRILVYDADSTALTDTSNIHGLLRKFRAEAPDAAISLAWIQGGFQAVWALRRDCIDVVPPTPETDETEDEEPDEDRAAPRILRAHHLPRAAFALTSTTQAPRTGPPLLNPQPQPHPAHAHLVLPKPDAPDGGTAAFNPFFDAVRQNAELAVGITERIPLRLPRRVRRRISELPFHWLREIARHAAPLTPSESSDSSSTSPASPRPHPHAVEEGMEALAMQFYRIELAEQRRLMGVMEHHSRESGAGVSHSPFPFSITAGVEKGSKNRYRNIWPFEHARVRLHAQHSHHDDYVNASYVQPLGTRRRYIATQGPLEATFGDFWTLVWQQNTHVIVMLTREVEGAMIKCGAYWHSGTYGPLRVELLGCAADGCPGVCLACAGEGEGVGGGGGATGFFASVGAHASRPQTPASPAPPQLIKRTLRLTHAGHPAAPPRRVVQLQYLGWPDMNVPEDARGVLGLVWEVGRVVGEEDAKDHYAPATDDGGSASGSDSEVDDATGVLRRALKAGGAAAPVLLHCSAGVGRTGGFIAVDAVLDAVRMEAREMYATERGEGAVGRQGSRGARVGGTEGIGRISADMRAAGIAEDVDDRMEIDNMDVDPEGQAEGRGMRTPMQVDSLRADLDDADMGETRRWAERVADTKVLSAFASASLPATAAPSAFSSAVSTPFHFQPPAHRTTFSLTLPTTHRSVPVGTNASHPQNPEAKAASLPLRPVAAAGALPLSVRRGKASNSPLPGKFISDRPLANSPVPDRPLSRSLSPFNAPTPPPASLGSVHSPDAGDAPAQGGAGAHVDYKEPRALHGRGGAGPVRLSAFEDPIWEVVQDMREQRMSLCQSLRQYVFVHAAIIEGALMVVDEERARAGVAWRPTRPALFLVPSDEAKSTTSSTGKRLASPTELLKEDKKGEIVLSKRPSIKRKQASTDGYAPPLPTFPPP